MTDKERSAFNDGKEGKSRMYNTTAERNAHNFGKKHAKPQEPTEPIDIQGTVEAMGMVRDEILKPLLKNSVFFYLAYKTAAFLSNSTYVLIIGTCTIAYFYLCISYYLRGRMIFLKGKNRENWKIIYAVLQVFHVLGPFAIFLFLIFSFVKLVASDTASMTNGMLIVAIIIGAFIMLFSLIKRHHHENVDEIPGILEWAYEEGVKDPETRKNVEQKVKPLPEGHRYPEGNGGLTRVFIFFAVLIAIIIYLNSQ